MARKSMKAERRAEIAQGLYRCIAKQGYAKTSVRDIAQEADIGLGLITHYFESKEEILYALADYVFAGYQQNFDDFFEKHPDGSPRKRLMLGIEFIFVNIAGDTDLNAVFDELLTLSRHDKKLRQSLTKLYKGYRDTVAGFLAKCLYGLDKPDENLQKLAAFLVSASEGVSEQWTLDPKGTRLSEMAETAYMLIDNLIQQKDK